ncbi:MAG: STAS domain-containing protein [Anaerolineae bacterium]|nr:STAS domain-containing protein [Anaerolineae bacterium]
MSLASTNRLMTRLTRELDSVWLLELANPALKDVSYVEGDEHPLILQILTKIDGHKLIIDLTSIQDLDLYGIDFLCLIYKNFIGRDIEIKLRNPDSHLREMLHRTQLDRVFEVEYTSDH